MTLGANVSPLLAGAIFLVLAFIIVICVSLRRNEDRSLQKGLLIAALACVMAVLFVVIGFDIVRGIRDKSLLLLTKNVPVEVEPDLLIELLDVESLEIENRASQLQEVQGLEYNCSLPRPVFDRVLRKIEARRSAVELCALTQLEWELYVSSLSDRAAYKLDNWSFVQISIKYDGNDLVQKDQWFFKGDLLKVGRKNLKFITIANIYNTKDEIEPEAANIKLAYD